MLWGELKKYVLPSKTKQYYVAHVKFRYITTNVFLRSFSF